MPRIHVFVDESNIGNRYILIGGIWVSERYRPVLEDQIDKSRARTGHKYEFKWKRVKRISKSAYDDLISNLTPDREYGFNCVVIDQHSGAYRNLGKDFEDTFYNIYFLLLSRKIIPSCNYSVYADRRTSPLTNPMEDVRRRCNDWWHTKTGEKDDIIRTLEPVDSKSSPVMQLADLFLGAVGDAFNQQAKTDAKVDIQKLIEKFRGLPLTTPSPSTERAFNVWVWDPNTGEMPSGITLRTKEKQ